MPFPGISAFAALSRSLGSRGALPGTRGEAPKIKMAKKKIKITLRRPVRSRPGTSSRRGKEGWAPDTRQQATSAGRPTVTYGTASALSCSTYSSSSRGHAPSSS